MDDGHTRAGHASLVITERSFQETEPPQLGGLESADRRRIRDRYEKIRSRLKNKSAASSANVFITVDDREASRFQSYLAREAFTGAPLSAGGLEAKFGTGYRGGDWWGWMTSVLNWVDRADAHSISRPTSSRPDAFPHVARIAMLADWGTGLYGAPVSAKTIANKGPFDLLLHLGDVYYSGTIEEVKSRFLSMWPSEAGKISRALNSNHEMYSGGFGYFQHILPSFNQVSSYFAYQNQHWLLVCLDTAYVDHEIDDAQAKWLNDVIGECGQRKVVLISHHQLFSRLDSQGPNLDETLSRWLVSGKIAAWYWGHEHECMLYDRHKAYRLYARCLGNGGVPEPRKSEVTDAETDSVTAGITWKRLPGTSKSPSCRVLDGSNPYVVGEEERFGPHGFMTLEFNGPNLTEKVFLPDGTEIFSNTIA